MRELVSIGPGKRQPGRLGKQLRIAVSGHKAQPDPSLLIPDLSVPLNFDDGPSVERTENKRRGSGGGATDVILRNFDEFSWKKARQARESSLIEMS